ncbi:MAG: cell division ATP-binding protein FtsE [Parcubacteria group bacterium]|nr:cell division ATP-binding protein FtsE [Parcubacteria group bacterium]
MIFFDKVSKIYSPSVTAIEDLTLKINPKEFCSVVGPSGAGKSTLLKLLISEERPSTGRIFIHDQDINQISRRRLPYLRRKIGMVFQDYKLLPTKTAFENVAFALEVAGVNDRIVEDDTRQVLEIVGLADKGSQFPDELSGGEKQRIALARALVSRPDVIVADEPTGNLDPLNGWDIIRLLIKINELGTTVILATHNQEIINSLGRRVITLEKGRLVSDEEKGQYVL